MLILLAQKRLIYYQKKSNGLTWFGHFLLFTCACLILPKEPLPTSFHERVLRRAQQAQYFDDDAGLWKHKAASAQKLETSNLSVETSNQCIPRRGEYKMGLAVPLLLRRRESQRAPGSYAITVKTTDDHVVHILIQKKADTGMYHVGGGDEFRTVSELLAHYNNNPMVEEGSQRVVHLMNLVPSTCVPADAIDERIRLLEEVDPVTKKSGFLEEFERIQQVDDQFSSRREGKKEQNVSRNRYKNIVPFDHTRVILKDVPPNESDYINASYIRIPKGPPLHLYANREYISTQGCLPNTLLDFWRMVWQENSRVIVMTTKEMERSRSKCHVYWPALREELNLREYVIKTVEEIKVPGDNGLDMFIKRRFMVAKKGMPQRELFHLQFIGWPDHGCPEQPESVLRFLDAVDVACKKAISSQGPVIVHCSAGIGRTGTFIVIDILLNQIRHRGSSCPIDIPRTVMKIREQRSRMVQTEAQYVFLYRAISCYVGMINRSRHPSDDTGDGGQPLHLPPPPVPRRRTAPDVAQAYVNNG
ncbi:Protein-tyrosine phosphatase [Ancylostoma caninum]|uniref:protein-tyrosine-phosphatase n=1 Tax=Ancylostoma caninum TaxID=29170 RepID=A0A368GUL0_ANCCA|nr:Protein-tyrosine phosphatase [Ancylostoma caninum]